MMDLLNPKIFLAILLLFLSYPSWAGNHASSFDIVEPPICTNSKGETVIFTNINNSNAPSAAGMANRDKDGLPVVYRFSYQKSPEALQRFVDLHECAHHQTGDIDLPHPPRNSPAHMMNESISDCIATLRIRDEYEDGESLLKSAIAELKTAMSEMGFPASTVGSRISNISNCFEKDLTSTEFIDGVLEHRGLIVP
ncbi:hypothetical protein AB8880_03395 [Alphaproteobacteria bacterium LSUCC0684]